jgi:hypothetical protein
MSWKSSSNEAAQLMTSRLRLSYSRSNNFTKRRTWRWQWMRPTKRCFNREKCHENHEKNGENMRTCYKLVIISTCSSSKMVFFTGEKCWDFIMKN